MLTIGITGSEGLIGTALAAALAAQGHHVRRLDLRLPPGHPGRGSVLDLATVEDLARGCDGLVHLAAVSRVILGERDPPACLRTNVAGTTNVLAAARAALSRPFVLLASSREVYGQAEALPVREDAPLAPVNVYGRSKAQAEAALQAAREQGLRAAVLRFSNVYGSIHDHADRVVPAFACAAALGAPLRVDGASHTFDFTHLTDTVEGLLLAIQALAHSEDLPPLHLLTGEPTTLGELAQLANTAGGGRSKITQAPPRNYDVSSFYGDPRRAEALLGFRARVRICDGVAGLVRAFAVRDTSPPRAAAVAAT